MIGTLHKLIFFKRKKKIIINKYPNIIGGKEKKKKELLHTHLYTILMENLTLISGLIYLILVEHIAM